eukprot:gnl/MRDRNA2_/MRDRNA2_85575_c0_seq1.p1 gnl/MRDRNA2_/MRDRNA2_85575_c0~~gnl/MRDRNA2_/MRDRNA2_85575_c0_seq1.p1  ORF type:complete len:340 (+),score=74.34 gnl/MRDRNA2_/MRDRNA2_85575_c0_seq1:92-1111(+)
MNMGYTTVVIFLAALAWPAQVAGKRFTQVVDDRILATEHMQDIQSIVNESAASSLADNFKCIEVTCRTLRSKKEGWSNCICPDARKVPDVNYGDHCLKGCEQEECPDCWVAHPGIAKWKGKTFYNKTWTWEFKNAQKESLSKIEPYAHYFEACHRHDKDDASTYKGKEDAISQNNVRVTMSCSIEADLMDDDKRDTTLHRICAALGKGNARNGGCVADLDSFNDLTQKDGDRFDRTITGYQEAKDAAISAGLPVPPPGCAQDLRGTEENKCWEEALKIVAAGDKKQTQLIKALIDAKMLFDFDGSLKWGKYTMKADGKCTPKTSMKKCPLTPEDEYVPP